MAIFGLNQSEDSRALDEKTIARLKRIVSDNLMIRRVKDFSVHVAHTASTTVILINTRPQPSLRHSGHIETQLLELLKAHTKHPIAAVFWRFREDWTPQVSEQPALVKPQSKPLSSEAKLKHEQPPPANAPAEPAPYDIKRLAREGMEVTEISFNEFNKFSNN